MTESTATVAQKPSKSEPLKPELVRSSDMLATLREGQLELTLPPK